LGVVVVLPAAATVSVATTTTTTTPTVAATLVTGHVEKMVGNHEEVRVAQKVLRTEGELGLPRREQGRQYLHFGAAAATVRNSTFHALSRTWIHPHD
jgi:hypothetical protein